MLLVSFTQSMMEVLFLILQYQKRELMTVDFMKKLNVEAIHFLVLRILFIITI